MKMLRCFSSSGVSCHRPFWLSSKLKSFISSGVIALIVVNNSPTPAKAQKLNQSSSTSPSHVAPQQGVTPLVTPSCSNNITFNEYPVGTPITTQYSNKGIIFGGDSPFITTDGANPTSPVLSGSPQFQGAIEGSFVDPKDGVTPAVAVNFQLDGGYFDSLNSTVLKLYDSQGKLIGQQTNTALGIFTFTVNNLPVAKWRIESVGDEPAGFAIDNVCFNIEKLQSSKQSPRFYPEYLKDDANATLASVTDADLIASGIPQPQDLVTPQPQDSVTPQSPNVAAAITGLQPDANSTPSISNIAEQSCQGIGYPLTNKVFFKLAKDISPGISEKDIRIAFEDFALRSQALRKYKVAESSSKFLSPERASNTNLKLVAVVPEAVSTVEVIHQIDDEPPSLTPYPESGFWDAKTGYSGKSISLSSGTYQTQGYLDYLSHYSYAAAAPVPKKDHPVGHLVYMTLADTSISQNVLDYTGATPGVPFTPVAVYQMVACLRPQASGASVDNYIQMGHGILLNAGRFDGYSPLRHFLPSGRPTFLNLP